MNSLPKITFLNKPKLSGHSVDQKSDEKRIFLVPQIEKFIIKHNLFKNKLVTVFFFHTGVSSLVCLLEIPEEKYVLKIALRPENSKGEALFLKVWGNIGVLVPHIFETGMINEHFYILMEYISAQTLDKAYSKEGMIEKGIFQKMGQILQQMHTVTASGYGFPTKDGIGKYKEFKTWLLENPQTKNQINYVQKYNLLPEEKYGSLEETLKIILNYVNNDSRSVYCHYDFSPGNIFDTEPLTIFDPSYIFNHPYFDLGKSIIQTIAQYPDLEVIKQLTSGYLINTDKHLNYQVLQAIMLFVAYSKFSYWHKKNKKQSIENVRKYLLIYKELKNKDYIPTS